MKTFTLTLLLALLTSGAALANPALRGDITVNADIVTVGDIFDNSGELSETAIFRAPAPGTVGIVPLADVQNAAKLVGITDFDNVGYMRIRVTRPASVVDATMLSTLISAELTRRGILTDAISAETHFDLTDVSFNAQQSEKPATLSDLRYTAANGAFVARFMIAGIDQPVDLSGAIQLMTTAPRLIATHPAGALLAATDFDLATVPLATATAGGYADLDQLIGKQLVRQSRAGLMLKPADVTDPTVVSRNTLVTVLFKVGAMTLTVKGQALGTVAAGQPVDVLNSVTKKILHGVARPDGTVEIVTANATVASL